MYLLEDKVVLDGRRYFSKVLMETIPLQTYADFIYVFGGKPDNFEKSNEDYIKECESKGIGILLIDDNKKVIPYLEAKRNQTNLAKKEAIYRIFNQTVQENLIAEFIYQSTYELYKKTNNRCAKFTDIYNALFSDEDYKIILDKILKGKHKLTEEGMKPAFRKVYGKKTYFEIIENQKGSLEQICVNENTEIRARPAILLD